AVEETANEDVARQLKVRPGRRIIRISTLGRADGRPISLGRHCFPAGLVPNMIEIYTKVRSVTKALKQIGISDYRRASTRVTARLPTPEEARLLRLGTSQPLLITEGINVEGDGRPIEYTSGYFASDRVQLVVGDR
ncbi:MAG: phosphonate metabolism transcriptional regulator PhnF, partial [Rhodospirillales bacterium]|nr:phosphonate metabolism transcriptional regulator PhnF [Rhodospirillales bacterium]